MLKFCEKSAIIEAFVWTADIDQEEDPGWVIDAIKKPWNKMGSIKVVNKGTVDIHLDIFTPEGYISVNKGDYIFRDSNKNIYAYPPKIFKKIYQAI